VSYVQGSAFSGATSGGAGASLTGVTAGHGLFAFLFFTGTTTPTSISIADSAGNTWALSGSIVQLTNAGESIGCAIATNAVVSGTHTLTVTFTGGGGCFSMLIEDTLTTLRSAAIGQLISSPNSGQTLNPGGTVGNSGDLVYMFALTDAGASSTLQPVAGTGGFTIPAALTGNSSGNGASWAAGYNASAGGTTPTMAIGSGALHDEHGVIAFGLIAGAAPVVIGAYPAQIWGPGISPNKRSTFRSRPLSIFIPAPLTSTAAIVEGLDTVAASSAAISAGSATISEASDTISASGVIILPYATRIGAPGPGISVGIDLQFWARPLDSTKFANFPCVAAIIEQSDIPGGLGFFGSGASAAILELPDTPVGVSAAAATSAAAIFEASDIVVGVAGTGNTASANIVELYDQLLGIAGQSSTSTAAILERSDTVVGLSISGVNAQATILEPYDGVSSTGLTGNVLTGSIVELGDVVTGTVVLSTSGTASIVESYDVPAGQASAALVCSVNITESADAVVVTLSVGLIQTAAIAESADIVVGVGGTAVSGTAAIVESVDIPLIVSFSPGIHQFGYAVVTALSPTGLPTAHAVYPELSSCQVTAAYFDTHGIAFQPNAVSYRIDDVATNFNILPWTAIVPASVNEVTITSAENAMISNTRWHEKHQVLFMVTDQFNDVSYARVIFDLIRIPGQGPFNVSGAGFQADPFND
jgi:hypothetical protein